MHRHRGRILVLALAPLTGCLVTGALDPTGGGRLTLKARLVSVLHFETLKTSLQGSDVVLKNASLSPKKWATFELEVRDVRRLWTAPALSRTSVAFADDEGARTLAVTMSNPAPERWSDALRRYSGDEAKITLDLPGEVIRSNATSTSGRTASWTWSLGDTSARPTTDLTVTFKLPEKTAALSPNVPELHRPSGVEGRDDEVLVAVLGRNRLHELEQELPFQRRQDRVAFGE